MPSDTSKKRIFVQMVSYRDPECHPTLRDMFEKASHPERVSVGLCWQYDPEEDMECFAEDYPRAEQVRVLQYHIMDAQGAGWARKEAQTLWAGEEYVLQIQSHMRFEPGWDEELIAMLEGLPSEKAVLTGWLTRYIPPNTIKDFPGLFPVTGVNIIAREDDAQMIHLIRRHLRDDEVPDKPFITPTWIGNFMFCRSEVMKAVPFDPHIYFWGEEINYSARLWTHGYDIYHVNKVLMYHYWGRSEAKDSNWYRSPHHEKNKLSLMRNRHLLGMGGATNPDALVDIEKYTLGTERSLSDYFKFYGVDLVKRNVEPFAKLGLWHAPQEAENKKMENRPRIFVAIASYRDPELSPTIADLFENATFADNIHIGVCLQRDPEKEPDCGVHSPRMNQISVSELHYRNSKGANWARVQALKMKRDEDYVLIIDSHMRFERRWDEILIDMLERCHSDKPAISARLPNYNPPNTRSQHPDQLIRTRIRRLGDEGDPQLVHVSGNYVPAREKQRGGLYPTPFLVNNFLFGHADMFKEVPVDPHFHFYGDEISYAARLWTYGYDIFQPDCMVMYHYWVRHERMHLQHYRRTDTQKSYISLLRVRHLLGIEETDDRLALKDIEQFGLGNERKLKDLWAFAGVDLKERNVAKEATEGWWNMESRNKAIKNTQKKATKSTKKKAAKPAKKKPAAKPKLPTIFVQIASYRDPECQHTIKDMFDKAKHPERITVGLVWQFNKEEDAHCFEVPYPYPEQVRVKEIEASKSKGVCWARAKTQKLYKGEDFTLQIDSHMRFEQDWDEILLGVWNDCENKNAIVTAYPPGYTPPNDLEDEHIFGMAAERFNEEGICLMKGRPAYTKDNLPSKPIEGAFLSGCMYFGPGRMIKDVPYDPNLYFFGEEISMAVRLWTHGYDFYHPNKPTLYHNWSRQGRTTHFEDHPKWPKANRVSFSRVLHMLGAKTSDDPAVLKDLDKYGLGTKRSLAEYQKYSEVDFAKQTFSDDAHAGYFGKKLGKPEKKVEPTVKKQQQKKLPKIFVQIASYRDRECQYTIKDLFEKAKHPENLSVGVCWQFDSDQDADCFKVTTRPEQVKMLPYDWREGEGVCWARNLTQSLWDGEEYTLQIDSHMRFVPGWDEYMLEELAACASDKPLLSCSPASYTPPNNLQLNPRPTIRRVMPFFPDGNLRGRGEYIDRSPENPLRGAFIAAGFLFSKSSVIQEVPYDPYMYFDQEEISYAARLFTHGWDVFSTRKPLLYHYYNSDNGTVRPLHWQDLGEADRQRIEFLRQRGIARFNHLVGHKPTNNKEVVRELEQYGFGTKRSLKEYEDFSGVDFKKKIATERALRCQFIEDLEKYRSSPIHVPEIDGDQPPKTYVKINDNKKAAKPAPSEPEEFTTLDPTKRMHKPYPGVLPKMEIGDYVPFFRLVDDENKPRAVEVLGGKHTMMLFFPARDEDYTKRLFGTMHKLLRQQEKMEMWQVFITDEAPDVLSTMKKSLGIEAPIWSDLGGHVARAMGAFDDKENHIVPVGFLLDRNLKIIGKHEKLNPEQLAMAMVNQCANTIEADRLRQGEPQIISQSAPVLIVPNVLTPEFCDYCIKEFENGHTFQGTVGSDKNTAMRKDFKMRTDFVVHGKLLDEIDEKFSRSLFPEIKKVFGFDVTYRELYKIGLYAGEDKGFFKQHRDNFDDPLGYRRIAMTIHLSDDYEGGGVRFPEYSNNIYRPEKGGAVAFSASSLHEALPVTKGKRYVIVAFIHGDIDEAYRRHYQLTNDKPLKIKDNAPCLREYPGVELSRNFFDKWKGENVVYNPAATGKLSSGGTLAKPVMINTRSGHSPKKVYESEQAIIMDDFLPQDVFERLHQYILKADYEYINMKGKVSRAWHVHDRHPMRTLYNAYYYAQNHPKKPEGKHVYPTKTDMDVFLEAMMNIQPHVEHLVGKESKDWWNLSTTGWIYPPGTALSIHDDGSGIYSGAYTFFMNPTWRPHWGGVLMMMDEEANRMAYEHREKGDQYHFYRMKYFHANNLDEVLVDRGLAQAVFPKGNRIVFIGPKVYHMISRVNEAAGDNLRTSIAGFYCRKQDE